MSEQEPRKAGFFVSQLWIYPVLAATVYLLIFYLVRPFAPELGISIQEVQISLLLIVVAAIFAIVAYRFRWLSTRPGQISTLIAVGFVLWAIAEWIWFGYELIGLEPFPSLADVFYVAGYFPFAAAFFLNIRAIRVPFSRALLVLWIVLSALTIGLVTSFLVLPIVLAGTGITVAVSITYPLEDIVVIMLILVVLLKFRSGEVAKPWALLVLGFILITIGDLLFTYTTWIGTYMAVYDPVDLMLSLGYVASIASGLYFVSLYRKP